MGATGLEQLSAQGGTAPLYFYTALGASIPLDGWFRGRACFLICNGPSLADANLGLLRRPGVMTFGMNNGWSVFRPRLWTCVDPPRKFHQAGWHDPCITKFVPINFAGMRLRVKDAAGKFHESRYLVRDMPSVLFYQRNCRFEPADFLVEPSVNYGNTEALTDSAGVQGKRNVMLSAFRLMHAVGFRTIYLVGADFHMDARSGYAFKEHRGRAAIDHNQNQYHAMAARLEALRPYFESEGVKVYNCNPTSMLTTFPHKRLSEAVAEATAHVDVPMDTVGWYAAEKKPRVIVGAEGGD